MIGHAATLAQVPDPLPSTLLLSGPEGVGKRLAAVELAERTGVTGLDFQNLGRLDREGSRNLLAHHSTAPLVSPVKVSVADITDSSPEAANSILKVLEAPPSYSRIILHSDRDPLLTIRSRCFNLKFGTLSEAEVATVLSSLGVSDPGEAARFSQGRVSVGLDYARNSLTRNAAEAILSAVVRQDAPMVEATLASALAGEDAARDASEVRRLVLCRLLARSLRSSLSTPDHALSNIPMNSRLHALSILDGTSRPALRARSATWVLLAN